MKKFILILLSILLISCKKEEVPPFDKYEHFIGSYNGFWPGNPQSKIYLTITGSTIEWGDTSFTNPYYIDNITEFDDDYVSSINTTTYIRNILINSNYTMSYRITTNTPNGWVQQPTTIVQLTKVNRRPPRD